MIPTMIVLAAMAQGPGGGATLTKSADVADLVERMMAFDKDADGTLSRAEIADARLLGQFDHADADGDGRVTRAELVAIGEAEHSDTPDFDRGPGGPGGPPPGFGGFPGPPPGRPGEILPAPLRRALRLTEEQKKRVDELQANVDAALAEILTDDQKKELKGMADRPAPPDGPGRRRPPDGPRR